MLSKLFSIGKDELFRGSFVLFVMFGFYNVLNYIFQMSMARTLGPSDYGVLAALMSLVYLFSIPTEAVQTVVARYTSAFNARREQGKIKDLLIRSLRRSTTFAFLGFILLLACTHFLSSFFSIPARLVGVTGVILFVLFTIPVTRGIIQGKKRFFALGGSLLIESFLKIIIALVLVIVGLGVYGAIIGVIIGLALAFVISLFVLRDVVAHTRQTEASSYFTRGNLTVLVAITAVVLLYSTDILFARKFFSPVEAGEFAFISLIGKVIFFSSAAVAKAMLPLSTEGFEQGRKTSRILKKAIAFVMVIALTALVFYLLIPREIIWIIGLGSDAYLGGADFLFTMGLAYSFFSIANIIVLYKISINRIGKHAFFLMLFPVIQIILFYLFHKTQMEFSLALVCSGALFLMYTLAIALKDLLPRPDK